jgi:hypothetical protein
MRLILALIAGAAAVTFAAVVAPPATAHFCSTPVEINVGEDVVVNIGVAAEDKPVRAVDIAVPDAFVLKEPIGYLGFTGTVDGKRVHFEGAEIAPYSCTYFSFAGHAARKGRLVARIVTTAVDGTKAHYNDLRPISQYPAQLIYAGVTMPTDVAPTNSDFPSIWVGVVASLVTGAAVVGGAYLVNRRGAIAR